MEGWWWSRWSRWSQRGGGNVRNDPTIRFSEPVICLPGISFVTCRSFVMRNGLPVACVGSYSEGREGRDTRKRLAPEGKLIEDKKLRILALSGRIRFLFSTLIMEDPLYVRPSPCMPSAY